MPKLIKLHKLNVQFCIKVNELLEYVLSLQLGINSHIFGKTSNILKFKNRILLNRP